MKMPLCRMPKKLIQQIEKLDAVLHPQTKKDGVVALRSAFP